MAEQGKSNAATASGQRIKSVALTGLGIAFLIFFWLFFFWDVLITRDHLIPFDLIDQHYMIQVFIHQALVDGTSPIWAPEILSGYPIVADPLAALFYPPNYLMHLFTPGEFLPYYRLEVQATLHYLWAAIGMYLLAYRLTGARAGAVIAALVFAFGGFFAWHVSHLSPISSLSWLPWVLLGYLLAIGRKSNLAWLGLTGLALGMLILAGHALTILQAVYLLLIIGGIIAFRQWNDDRRLAGITLLKTGAILATGVALSAVQLLPALELSQQSNRSALSFGDATVASYLPNWIVTAIVPDFFSHSNLANYWASGDIAETNMYFGLIPLLLAILGFLNARQGADRRITYLLLGGSLLALLLALGSETLLYRVVFETIPGFDRVRRPLNNIALVHLGFGLLAAYGIKALGAGSQQAEVAYRQFRRWLRFSLLAAAVAIVALVVLLAAVVNENAQDEVTAILDSVIITVIMLVLTYLIVRGRLTHLVSAQLAILLLVAVTALDIATANAGVSYKDHIQPPDSYIGVDWAGNPDDPAVRFLQAEHAAQPDEPGRIYPDRAGSIWLNGPLVWELESTDGYSVLWPAQYERMYAVARNAPWHPLVNLMNTRYFVFGEPVENIFPEFPAENLELVHQSSVWIYENRLALPRTWIAFEAIELPDDQIIDWIAANGQSIQNTVILNEPVDGRTNPGVTNPGEVRIVEYETNRVALEAVLPEDGWVVLADTFYPGWEASIDGVRTDILRAYGMYRAVWVPAGEHEITYQYEPAMFYRGAVISMFGLLAIVGLLLAGTVQAIRQRSESGQ